MNVRMVQSPTSAKKPCAKFRNIDLLNCSNYHESDVPGKVTKKREKSVKYEQMINN